MIIEMQQENELYVPALVQGDKVIIPQIFHSPIAEGGEDILVDHMPNGWPTARDPNTGWPLKVSDNKEDAIAAYGQDASRFVAPYSDYKLYPVLRDFLLYVDGPFFVYACYGPDYGDSGVGGRACRRLEQDAEHLATPLQL